jgi:hypothetical protein
MLTNDFIEQLIQDLGEACGLPLILIAGSWATDGVFASATARSWQRAAPAGFNHRMLCWQPGDGGVVRWQVRGWEADVYEEWTESDRLDDDEV